MQSAAWWVKRSGSLYLDSSGKAPTEFWSEELEKAGEERVKQALRSLAARGQGLGPSTSLGGRCLCPYREGQVQSRPALLALSSQSLQLLGC